MKKTVHIFILTLLVFVTAFAQKDSTQQGLSFDFGFTRGKNIELWPLIRKYKDAEVKETQVLFSIYSKQINYNQNTKHFHFLPFFSSDSNSAGYDHRIITTVYPNVLRFQKDSVSKSFKFIELAPNISFLGVTKSANGLYVDNNIFFFLWYKNDRIHHKQKFILFPAYWYWADTTQSNHLIFPVFRSKTLFGEKDTTYKKTVFPLYWHSKNKSNSHDVLFPLLWKYHNPSYSSFTLFPIFSAGHSNDSLRSQRHLNIVGLYTALRKKDSNTNVFFPFIWKFENAEKKSFTFFPIFSTMHSKTDSTESRTNILGLFNLAKNQNKTQTTLFPLLFFTNIHSKYDTSNRKIVFPLWWSHKDRYETNHVFFPFVWSYDDNVKKSFTFFPLFSYSQTKDSATKTTKWNALLLFYHNRKPSSISNFLFPIAFSETTFKRYDTTYLKSILPLYWQYKDKNESDKVLFPIFWSFNDNYRRSFSIFPLFSFGYSKDSIRSRSYWNALFLFYHKKKPGSVSDVLFPIVWSKTKFMSYDTVYRKTVFPIIWSYKDRYENNKVIFPLLWSYDNISYRSLTFFPIFSIGRNKDSTYSLRYFNIIGIFRRYHRKDYDRDVVFPLYWHTKRFRQYDTTSETFLIPIYWAKKTKTENSKILFPILWRFKNSYKQSTTIFPLVSWGHSTDSTRSRSYYNILGLFTHTKTPTQKKNVFFPFVWNRNNTRQYDTSQSNTVFPLYWLRVDQNRNKKVLFPIVWRLEDNLYKSFTIAPLISVGHAKDSSGRSHANLLGIFHHQETKDSKTNVLFPLLWFKKSLNTQDSVSSKVIFPFYWNFGNAKQQNTVLFPFVWKFNNTKRKSLALISLFYYKQSNDSSHATTFNLLGIYHQSNNLGEKRRIIFPFYWNKSSVEDSVQSRILFPFWWKINKNHYQSTTLFPFVSFGHSTDSAQTFRHQLYTPFVGQITKGNERTSFLFPLFKHKKSEKGVNYSFLYLLFQHSKKEDKKETSFLWPLFTAHKSKSESKYRIVPIVWRRKTDSSSMFSIQPLFYLFRSTSEKSFILSWYLYKYENEIGISKSHSFLWKVLTTKRYTNGDYESRFLHLLYANVKKEGKTEKSLFPFYHKKSSINGDKSISVLFGFYNHFKQYKPDIKEFYEEERILWFLRLRSNYNQLKQKGKAGNLKRK